MTTTPAAGTQPHLPDDTPPDTRRISEQDADFQRLRTTTERRLTRSVQQLVRDLRTQPPTQHGDALTTFINRHVAILRSAYLAAHREGLRDYFSAVARPTAVNRWMGHVPSEAAAARTIRQRLGFYAPSVAKMAHEAQLAWHATQIQRLLTSERTSADNASVIRLADDGGSGDALAEWQDGLGVRLTLQADLTWSGMQDGYRAGGASDVGNPYRYLWWDLEPLAQHCEDCPLYAGGSPYDPYGTAGGNILDATPGDGHTACGAACKCGLRYSADVASGVLGAPFDPTRVLPDAMPLTPLQEVALANLPPAGAGPLNDDQKAALDLYRATAYAWDGWRQAPNGNMTLPPLPNFAELWDPTSDAMDLWSEALPHWDQLTPQQQQLFAQMIEALLDWGQASQVTMPAAGAVAGAATTTTTTTTTNSAGGDGAAQS